MDWRPWGSEALEVARSEDRPILLSIGYSSCHWCHVMERESFEDPETAAFMNEHFVPIKVDREERPDVDAIYMEAVQGMTGQGGWPLTAFCDPEGVPFYGGTYFPPEQRHGMPSLRMVMEAVAESWQTQRERITETTGQIRTQLGAVGRIRPADTEPGTDLLDAAERNLRETADPDRRRLRRRAQVPTRVGAGVPDGSRRARDRREHARRDGLRRHPRPGRRRLRPLLGGRRVAGAPLREDAL